MKQLLSILIGLFFAQCLFAQDIIMTKTSIRIEAQVVEISDGAVTYRLWGDDTNPVQTLAAEQVAFIIFVNGEVFTFENAQTHPESPAEETTSEAIPEWVDYEEQEIPITLKSGRTVMYRSGEPLGSVYNGFKFKGNEQMDFLRQTCPEAYQEVKLSNTCGIIGGILAMIGLGTLCYEGIKYLGFSENENEELGLKCKWIGVGCMSIGITFAFNASHHLDKSVAIFNNKCASPQHGKMADASLAFNISPVGGGLTLSF
ncbi:MAG: hypothetical protein MJZ24_11305 [Paludibacteraceae bacterium]|nr:hypothetical protein [Paludibacteraceae bacterium]